MKSDEWGIMSRSEERDNDSNYSLEAGRRGRLRQRNSRDSITARILPVYQNKKVNTTTKLENYFDKK